MGSVNLEEGGTPTQGTPADKRLRRNRKPMREVRGVGDIAGLEPSQARLLLSVLSEGGPGSGPKKSKGDKAKAAAKKVRLAKDAAWAKKSQAEKFAIPVRAFPGANAVPGLR